MDTQIWYSIFCTLFGGFYGIIQHLGEVAYPLFAFLEKCILKLKFAGLACILDYSKKYFWNFFHGLHLDSYNGNGAESIPFLAICVP